MYSARGLDPSPDGEVPLPDLVLALSRRLRRGWSDGLAPWGLSPHQARALRVVTQGERRRLGDLAAELRIAPRSATEVVDGLVELGLVVRVPDPSDRRAVYVEPTETGRRTSEEIIAARTADAEVLFSTVSEPDQVVLRRILLDLIDAEEQPR